MNNASMHTILLNTATMGPKVQNINHPAPTMMGGKDTRTDSKLDYWLICIDIPWPTNTL